MCATRNRLKWRTCSDSSLSRRVKSWNWNASSPSRFDLHLLTSVLFKLANTPLRFARAAASNPNPQLANVGLHGARIQGGGQPRRPGLRAQAQREGRRSRLWLSGARSLGTLSTSLTEGLWATPARLTILVCSTRRVGQDHPRVERQRGTMPSSSARPCGRRVRSGTVVVHSLTSLISRLNARWCSSLSRRTLKETCWPRARRTR